MYETLDELLDLVSDLDLPAGSVQWWPVHADRPRLPCWSVEIFGFPDDRKPDGEGPTIDLACLALIRHEWPSPDLPDEDTA